MDKVSLVLGADHDCGYLTNQIARSVYVDPALVMTQEVYSAFVANGFRRSGRLVYRPYCQACAACRPVRVSSARFEPNRSQRRTTRRNSDLFAVVKPAEFNEEHYRLFLRYQSARHEGGEMAWMSRSNYIDFLSAPWGVTHVVEFRDVGGALVSVAVVDELVDGLSAVYTFFDPILPQRGLGTFAVLWQLTEAKRLGLPWVYLGFWIEESPKMNYKARFQPLQVLSGGQWRELANLEGSDGVP